MKRLLRLLTELSSRKFVSVVAGRFAKSKLSKGLIPHFARVYDIRVDEAEKPLAQYETLNEFFTRRLKPGSRPIDPDPAALISPVDGVVTAVGKATQGKLLQIKGQDYDVVQLLGGSPRSINYREGHYIVIYLSPSDYHRIHAPVSGDIVESERIAGRVYPVNRFAMQHIRGVLSSNERLITYIRHDGGELALVKVGALNVSSIQYIEPERRKLERGDELAMFEFGSTVVILTEKDSFEPSADLREDMRIRMGQPLGFLQSKKTRNVVEG
jgi:phosphatidylserine decarboxylase